MFKKQKQDLFHLQCINYDSSFMSDRSLSTVNYQILDYNTNLISGVLEQIICLISTNNNLKMKNININYESDNSYKKLLVNLLNLIFIIEQEIYKNRANKKKFLPELFSVVKEFKENRHKDMNFLLFNTLNLFQKFPETPIWTANIKKIVLNKKNIIDYMFEMVEKYRIKEYGHSLLYKDINCKDIISSKHNDKKLQKVLSKDFKTKTYLSEKNQDCKENTKRNVKKETKIDKLIKRQKAVTENSCAPENNTKKYVINKSTNSCARENILETNCKKNENLQELLEEDYFFDTPEIDITMFSLFSEDFEDQIFDTNTKQEYTKETAKQPQKACNINITTNVILQSSIHSKPDMRNSLVGTDCKLQNTVNNVNLDFEFRSFADLPKNVKKIAEASFSEVFSSGNLIYKIIPLDKNFDTKWIDFVREAKALQILSNEYGVTVVKSIFYTRGPYTLPYLKAWDEFKNSENARPDFYTDDQVFGVIVTDYGGICLENVKFRSVIEITKILDQIVDILVRLETKYNFEHRDLHWGNILVNNNKVQIIDVALCRLQINNEIIYKDLSEISWIFDGDEKIDNQFGIYRKMKEAVNDNWEIYCPKTNVFWLTYLVDKLFNKVKSQKSTSVRKKYLQLLGRSNSLLDFKTQVKNYISF